MRENAKRLSNKAGGKGVIAVVKANAYGHGALEVARGLQPVISQFGVASVDEAIELREGGIESPILVFAVPTREMGPAFKEYRLTATVSGIEQFERLKPGTSYQLNIDTGMRRVGITPDLAEECLNRVERHKDLDCCGVYSHFATADEPESETVLLQHRRFLDLRPVFSQLGVPFHMSNTAAVAHYKLDHFDLVRVGIGLSGYTPGRTQWTELKPALEWTTSVAQVRAIRKGEAVSYGHQWHAPTDGYLATLPVGYADGLDRALTNRLEVRISGDWYPVVGTITMDYCLVFLGEKRVEPGSEVILMGDRALRANEWAERAGTITHETLCRLTERVRRVYQSG
jgi:alanine racemase